jgi:hypothetical protein
MPEMSRLGLGLCALAACGGGGGFPDARVIDAPPTGTFALTWSVIDHESQPISCERIAGQSMTVLTRNLAFEGGSTQVFSCSTGMGQSQAVVAGTYELNFELTGTFGLLARGEPQRSVVIPPHGTKELDPVVFQVPALGNVELQVSSGQSGGNCAANNAGGAGIDAMTITLARNSDLACQPVTFDISAGATRPAGSYTIDCANPVQVPCIEHDQVLSAAMIPSDGYTVRVRGRVNQKDCWINNDSIQIPPLDKTLTRTLNLARDTSVPGC